MPTGQVFRWHLRIMMQPLTMSGAVAKPNSSAPSSAADGHVAAGLDLAVGTCTRMRLAQVVLDQHLLGLGQAQLPGQPGVLDGLRGEAPVPPSWPLMSTRSALPLATPAAMVPTPTSETSFTRPSRSGLAFFRSWMSCARSSIE
jgi:hypothetical protein